MNATRPHAGWRARALALTATLALAGGTAAVTATPAHAVGSLGRAYVWANSPSHALNTPYAPSAAYSRNSTGAANSVVRTGTGLYTVRLANLGRTGGTVHVTAYGATSNTCAVRDWNPVGNRLDVRVSCFTRTGLRVNTPFTASFVNTSGLGGSRFGYVWANNPTSAAYTPSTAYQFNSSGALNAITRSGTGRYTVRLRSIGAAAGHVQVTAYGDTSARCKVGNWFVSGADQLVNVRCHDRLGNLRDQRFTLTYARATGIQRATPAAYAWANLPGSAAYNPSAAYSYNSSGVVNRIRRVSQGIYRFYPPNQQLSNGNVQVTAYGGDSKYCKVERWNPTDGVQVRCYTVSGSLTDTYYDVSFQR
ncbi:hypothetical protein ACIQUQ_04255 [Streptomyces sp. NPDC101118]|uniref:hypothetical protein n=1 Tax=Streptomyces sp. NPDC101118 TaxID=3366109 RepID=UPI00382BFCD6